MKGELYAGECLIGSLEVAPELSDGCSNWWWLRFRPSPAYEAFREILEPPRRKNVGLTEEQYAAIDALDLRMVLDGREARYRYVSIRGDVAGFRPGHIRFSESEEKEWRGRQAAHRSGLSRLWERLTKWRRRNVDR